MALHSISRSYLAVLLPLFLFLPAFCNQVKAQVRPLPPASPATIASSTAKGGATTARPGQMRPRVVVLLLGGVTWEEWANMASPSWRMPYLRRVLGQGAQGALELPTSARTQGDKRQASAVTHLALQLSAGTLPLAGTKTEDGIYPSGTYHAGVYHPGEWLRPSAQLLENGSAGDLFVRRTLRRPAAGQWVVPELASLLFCYPSVGQLAGLLKTQGRRAAAVGNADFAVGAGALSVDPRLREWGLLAMDSDGLVSGGEVSGALLRKDGRAPFGLRQDHIKTMQAFLRVWRSPDVGLVALEWGDTRRAALAAPRALPKVARAQQELALRRADFILKALLPRLAPQDRLVLLAVPQLEAGTSQLLPVVVWGRNSRGGTLEARQDQGAPGVPVPEFAAQLRQFLATGVPFAVHSGQPPSTAPEPRLAAQLALQAGVRWLEGARPAAWGIWAIFYSGALWATLAYLLAPRPSRRLVARSCWLLAMAWPLLLWLAGPCLELVRRTVLGPGMQSSLTMLAFALLLVVLGLGAMRCVVPHFRAHWLAAGLLCLTLLGVLVGGFALEWNVLFTLPPVERGVAPIPGAWALLLVGATLAGVGALAQPRQGSQLASAGQVLNIRPVTWWLLLLVLFLGWPHAGGNRPVAWLAALGASIVLLKLWSARAEFPRYLGRNRGVLRVATLFVLLVGAVTWELRTSSFGLFGTAWMPAPWAQAAPLELVWWLLLTQVGLCCGVATLCLAGTIRPYLWRHFSQRAVLTSLCVVALPATLLMGPAALPLLAFWPLAALSLGLMQRPFIEAPPLDG